MRGHCLVVLSAAGLLSLAFGLSCTTTERKIEARLSIEEQRKLEEARAEMEIGRNMAGRLLKFYGAHPDEKLVRYVNEVGLFVARYSDAPERRYMFEVYNSETVNAFACPGGYILISLGAVKTASNEAELAHILGHEIAHVSHRHMYTTLTKMNQDELDKAADQSSQGLGVTQEMQARMRPDPEESAMGALLARYLSGNAAGLNILKAAKAGMSLIMERGLGADLEFEADREGTSYAIDAGYHPKALVNFLCRMETNRGRPKEYCLTEMEAPPPTMGSILDKTHPSVPARVSHIKKVLVTMKAEDIVGAKGKKRFMTMKERLVVVPGPPSPAQADDDESKDKD
jgi:predicted Zn-dependent protease